MASLIYYLVMKAGRQIVEASLINKVPEGLR